MVDTLHPSKLFELANFVAMTSWILLIFFPGKRVTKALVRSGLSPLLLAAGYWASMIAMIIFGIPDGAGFGSFEGVRRFFTSEWGLLAGWIHYLSFDLLIGISVQQRIEAKPFAIRFLCLFLIFMFGPIGWSLSKLFNLKKEGNADAPII